jgi:Fe-S cluster assembly protein SufD
MEKIYSKDWYVSNFRKLEESLNGEAKSEFHKVRTNALEMFEETGFPTTKMEDWKYTNISPIFNHKYEDASPSAKVTLNDVEKFRIKDLNTTLLVFINGKFNEKLSTKLHELTSLNVKIGSLADWIKREPELVLQHFSKYARMPSGFASLNTAFTVDGTFIYIPDKVIVKEPVHILNLHGEEGSKILSQPRNLIVTGKNVQAKFIETYNSIGSEPNFSNIVTEIVAGENSNIEWYKIQDENLNSYQVTLTQAEQKRGSVFTIYTVTTGGSLVRNDINTVLDDENCEAHLFGLYLTEDSQHIDNHTLIDHAMPHCVSNELFKGVLNDKSHAIFNGKVYVRPDAQKTNAYQSNKNILLSKEATIDTKPQLEIFADDVKCSHGATVGQLDDDSVFYLRTRGISEKMAHSMLIRAFASDVFEDIKLEQVNEHINNIISNKLKQILKG